MFVIEWVNWMFSGAPEGWSFVVVLGFGPHPFSPSHPHSLPNFPLPPPPLALPPPSPPPPAGLSGSNWANNKEMLSYSAEGRAPPLWERLPANISRPGQKSLCCKCPVPGWHFVGIETFLSYCLFKLQFVCNKGSAACLDPRLSTGQAFFTRVFKGACLAAQSSIPSTSSTVLQLFRLKHPE